MKLMTKELEKEFKKADGKTVVAKYFDPCGAYTLWATEYDPETKMFFGYVTGLWEDEWGYTSLDEMESVKGPFGLGIERDLYFNPTEINKALKDYYGENAPKAA